MYRILCRAIFYFPGREHNFKVADNINSLDVEYDPQSVMHYSK